MCGFTTKSEPNVDGDQKRGEGGAGHTCHSASRCRRISPATEKTPRFSGGVRDAPIETPSTKATGNWRDNTRRASAKQRNGDKKVQSKTAQ